MQRSTPDGGQGQREPQQRENSEKTPATQTITEQNYESGRQRKIWDALKRLGPYLEGLKVRWLFGMLAAVGAGVMALAIPQVLGGIVDDIDDNPVASVVWVGGGIILVLGILEAVMVFLRRFLVLPPASDAETSMRTTLFNHLVYQPSAFHAAWDAGQLQSRAIADLNMLRRFFAFGSIMIVTASVTIIVGFTLMFINAPMLAAIFLCAAIPIMLLSPRFRMKFIHFSRASQDKAGDVATKVEESVHGIRVLKAFGRGEHARQGFREEAGKLRFLEVSKARTLATFQLIMILLPEGILATCLLVGLWQVGNGTISTGTLSAFFATAVVLKQPIEGVGMLLSQIFMAKTSLDRHIDVIDIDPAIQSPEEPKSAPEKGVVELENVHFRFPDQKKSQRDIVDGVNLRIEPGETMALVSHTGGGTSTLLNLIPRLYDVTDGTVKIDGVDVRDFSLPDLRSRITIAFEDPTLFSASVKGNVLLGTGHDRDEDDVENPYREAAPSDDELEAVLTKALHTADAEFVENLPQHENTRIGEEGLSLSGGQRQRLALARAIASNPSVLLLDDPLSALDVRTEERVTDRLRDVLEGTTTLIVAHRPSTVALADRVALLHEGKIADVGTHLELLERSSLYRKVMSPAKPSGEDLMNAVAEEVSHP